MNSIINLQHYLKRSWHFCQRDVPCELSVSWKYQKLNRIFCKQTGFWCGFSCVWGGRISAQTFLCKGHIRNSTEQSEISFVRNVSEDFLWWGMWHRNIRKNTYASASCAWKETFQSAKHRKYRIERIASPFQLKELLGLENFVMLVVKFFLDVIGKLSILTEKLNINLSFWNCVMVFIFYLREIRSLNLRLAES